MHAHEVMVAATQGTSSAVLLLTSYSFPGDAYVG
jgi:hypothetical protein